MRPLPLLVPCMLMTGCLVGVSTDSTSEAFPASHWEWRLRLDASPGGINSVFTWAPPKGATLAEPRGELRVLVLELHPVGEPPASLRSWGYATFLLRSGQAVPLATFQYYSEYWVQDFASGQPLLRPARLAPAYMVFYARESLDGVPIHFVFSAKASVAATLEFHLRVADVFPEAPDPPAWHAEQPPDLASQGTYLGFQTAFYSLSRRPSGLIEEWTPTLTRGLQRATDHANFVHERAMRLDTDAGSQRGWGISSGFLDADVASGSMRLLLEQRGQRLEDQGPVLDSGWAPAGRLAPFPNHLSIYEGDGASRSRIELDLRLANWFEYAFAQVDLGATVLEMVGAPSLTGLRSVPRPLNAGPLVPGGGLGGLDALAPDPSGDDPSSFVEEDWGDADAVKAAEAYLGGA